MVAAHGERHAMAPEDLVAIVNDRNFGDPANGENETLWWINHSRETVDPHPAEVRDGERAALKLLRLHPLVTRAMGQILCNLADLTERFILCCANHRRGQSVVHSPPTPQTNI